MIIFSMIIYLDVILHFFYYFSFLFYPIYIFLVLIANNLLHTLESRIIAPPPPIIPTPPIIWDSKVVFSQHKLNLPFFMHKYSMILDATSWFSNAILIVSQHPDQISQIFAIRADSYLSTNYFLHFCVTFLYFTLYSCLFLHQLIYIFCKLSILFTIIVIYNAGMSEYRNKNHGNVYKAKQYVMPSGIFLVFSYEVTFKYLNIA